MRRLPAVPERPSQPPGAADASELEPIEPRTEPPSVEEPEAALDPEVVARREEALSRIRRFGDPILRTRARAVDRIDDSLRSEIERMGRLMGDALGVGLAATQVGVLHRLLVYRVVPDAPVAALINPTLEWTGEETEPMEEGCLSLPGVLVDVERPIQVRVRALGAEGEELLVEASGLEARVIQHEIDHLDGVLILDRTSREQRREAIRALREATQGEGAPRQDAQRSDQAA